MTEREGELFGACPDSDECDGAEYVTVKLSDTCHFCRMVNATDDKVRHQGQRGGEPKYICPDCGEYVQAAYIRKTVNGKRTYVFIGYACPSNDCGFFARECR